MRIKLVLQEVEGSGGPEPGPPDMAERLTTPSMKPTRLCTTVVLRDQPERARGQAGLRRLQQDFQARK